MGWGWGGAKSGPDSSLFQLLPRHADWKVSAVCPGLDKYVKFFEGLGRESQSIFSSIQTYATHDDLSMDRKGSAPQL